MATLAAARQVIRAALSAQHCSADDVGILEMHGTGTGLGDPIEVGAAFAVFRSAVAGTQPLELQAAKNRLAHTEPAAGAVGLAAAAARLGRADAGARFLHLRALNPYVASIAEGFSRQRSWAAHRQPGALLGSPDLQCGRALFARGVC